MSTALPFVKVHGLGNDFILVDGPAAQQAFPPNRARRLCDRNFGVGADGILLVLPGDEGEARMRIINADGSLAEMCGNGIRCFARHVVLERGLKADEVLIDTDAGPKACRILRSPEGAFTAVRVAMGPPEVRPGTLSYDVDGVSYTGRFVSMGNPHLVLFLAEAPTRDLAERIGPALVAHPDFPGGTNVELAHVRADDEIDLVVYERGVGITLACGTGATATAAAACAEGLTKRARPITLHLLGGDATIEIAEDDSESWLEGPAEESFRGTTNLYPPNR